MRTINVTRGVPSIVVSGSVSSYQMTLTAADAEEMPDEIFLMNRRPSNPADPDSDPVDEFFNVCTPLDIQTYSVDNPADGQSQFRVASFSVYSATLDDSEAAWDAIKADIQLLKDSLDANDRLDDEEVFTPT